MKPNGNTLLSILLCAVLVLAALCIGSFRGWSSERADILHAFTKKGEMHTRLQHRGYDAANLAVVAARHLPADDGDLAALREGSRTLLSGTEDMALLLSVDDDVTNAALRLADSLPTLSTVQASQRDQTYISMLTAALSPRDSVRHSYTLLAEDFNQRLEGSLLGRLALLMGVNPLPEAE